MTGVDGKRVIDGRPETLRRTLEAALVRLRTDVIDLYYLHRLDRNVPVEESVGAMAGFVREGKVRALGLSEVSAAGDQSRRNQFVPARELPGTMIDRIGGTPRVLKRPDGQWQELIAIDDPQTAEHAPVEPPAR